MQAAGLSGSVPYVKMSPVKSFEERFYSLFIKFLVGFGLSIYGEVRVSSSSSSSLSGVGPAACRSSAVHYLFFRGSGDFPGHIFSSQKTGKFWFSLSASSHVCC
ncbi:hypothetical protein HPP92_015972 [Vanilla planifolia]|uniref:Uncharacterized protein n=1 Tax=Vanilla planifolia TaxID=51239 RepID=A0A835QDY0_VANPL|nr:hypothetical protein HPP92_015972 [Vanilla planifolia]